MTVNQAAASLAMLEPGDQRFQLVVQLANGMVLAVVKVESVNGKVVLSVAPEKKR